MNRIILILTTVAAVATTLPSQGTRSESSPDAWKFLSQKYDKNKDGKITAEEHGRSESSFRNLDQNGDGVITAADIPAGDMRGRRGGESRRGGRGAGGGEGQRGGESRRGSRGAGGGGNMPMAMLMGRFFSRFVDDDGDGKVTAKEWEVFVGDSDPDQSGTVTQDELADNGLPERLASMLARMLDSNGDQKLGTKEFQSAFATVDKNQDQTLAADELQTSGGRDAGGRGGTSRGGRGAGGGAPAAAKAGEIAPDFDLPLVKDHEKTVKLSSFAKQKPVALIFGSYT